MFKKGERKTVENKNVSEKFSHKKMLWIYVPVYSVAFSFIRL